MHHSPDMFTTDTYAVFGNPIEHSKSPVIHTMFAEQAAHKLDYYAHLVALDGFEEALLDFAEKNGKGLNVTIPFKQTAFELVTNLSQRAQRAGAVNTIVIHNKNEYYGDNTDGIGLARDLIRNHNVTLTGKRILLLGAGGAVRGVLEPLLGNKPAQLTIANRTVEKALSLADDFSELGTINGCGFNDLQHLHFDIIINGTSASLKGKVPQLPTSLIHKDTFCYDMVYADHPTIFMQWAHANGADHDHIADGLGMLVEQAAESFRVWRGIDPETSSVIQAVRRLLTKS